MFYDELAGLSMRRFLGCGTRLNISKLQRLGDSEHLQQARNLDISELPFLKIYRQLV